LKYLEGSKYNQSMNIEDNRVARRIAEEVFAMCPDNPWAYFLLALVDWLDCWLGSGKSPQESIEKSIEMARKALAMDDSIGDAHALLGHLYALKREYDKAIAEGERAVALDPGGALVHNWYGMSLYYVGRLEEAFAMFQKAMRLNPFGSPPIFFNLGQAYRLTGRFDEAVSAFKKLIEREPNFIFAHIQLAATYIMMGREKEARAEATEVLRINPEFSLDYLAKRAPFKDQSVTDNLISALRKAGLK
jgi:adenylate cyclase